MAFKMKGFSGFKQTDPPGKLLKEKRDIKPLFNEPLFEKTPMPRKNNNEKPKSGKPLFEKMPHKMNTNNNENENKGLEKFLKLNKGE